MSLDSTKTQGAGLAPAAGAPEPASLGDEYILRARSLIERAIRRRWSEGLITRDEDGVFTAYLGAAEVERLMRAPAAEPFAPLEEAVYDPATPLGQLVVTMGLRSSEMDLLAVLLACETDPLASRLVTYLSGNKVSAATIELCLEIIYRPRAPVMSDAARLLHQDLGPSRPLRRLRLLMIDGSTERVALAQGIRLHPRLVTWLLGNEELDAELAALVLVHREPPLGECDPAALATVCAALAAGGRLVLIEGPAESGREMLLALAAARLGRSLMVVRGRGLGPDRLVAAFREARLARAVLAIRDAAEVLAGESLLRLSECLDVFPDSVALLTSSGDAAPAHRLRPTSTVNIQVPPHAERLRLWGTYLGEDSALSANELHQISSLYNLGTAGIIRASLAARETARFAGVPLGRAHVAAAVGQLFEVDLSTVATRLEVTQTWEDLVLPDDVGDSIVDIIDRIRYRGQVLGKWGFARKLGKGLGLTVLLSGEPGTGKSMAAGLIAASLGLDLYVIDLSRIMSKWLGETEKNLARAFDAAEAGHVLLLFDEADSVLCKRSSDIRSSNDRHANLETNFILARLEQFQGIAFFTTNMPSAIDPAVSRRMSVHVSFPFPDADQRAELWRRMLPAETPVEPGIDFEQLGARYELSGGFIRNIVLRAAYIAAREGTPVGQHHLEQAAEREYRERGSLLVGGRLR